jgi:hypothetical protein
MTYRPSFDFETDIEELPADEAKARVESVTNMTVTEAERLLESQRFNVYNDRASGQETEDPPIEGGPTEDFIHLMETPADEWAEDELAEADELLNYGARTVPQYGPDEGEPLLPDEDPDIHKGEMALATWGFDMEPDDGWP